MFLLIDVLNISHYSFIYFINVSWWAIVLNISHSKYLEHADITKKLHAIISLNKSLFNFCIFVVDFMHNDKLNASCDILLDRIIHLLTTYFSRSLFSFYVIYSTCIIPLFQPSYVDQYLHNYVIYRKCGIYEQLVLKNLYSWSWSIVNFIILMLHDL